MDFLHPPLLCGVLPSTCMTWPRVFSTLANLGNKQDLDETRNDRNYKKLLRKILFGQAEDASLEQRHILEGLAVSL